VRTSEHLERIAARGAPFTSCSAAEKAALERYEAEINAAKGSLQRRSSSARRVPEIEFVMCLKAPMHSGRLGRRRFRLR
jgi:hypothetical protein